MTLGQVINALPWPGGVRMGEVARAVEEEEEEAQWGSAEVSVWPAVHWVAHIGTYTFR